MFKKLIIVSLLSGCAAAVTQYTPVKTPVSKPPLNSVNVAQIGDLMLLQGDFIEHDAIYVKSETIVSFWGRDLYKITPGYFTKEREYENLEIYKPSPYGTPGSIVKILPTIDDSAFITIKDKSTLCAANYYICTNGAQFERTIQQGQSVNSFQQSLIYSGKLGNKLRISYREFSGSMARPAFNNDVEYDLSESMFIGYKGARLEVLEATNERIQYRVLRNFN